jgi:hypothetical protein
MVDFVQKVTDKRMSPVDLPEMSGSFTGTADMNSSSIFLEKKKGKSLSDWLAIGGFFGATGAGLAWSMQNEAYTSKSWKIVKLHNDILAGPEKPMFKSICMGRMRKAPPSKKLLVAAAIGLVALRVGALIKNSEDKNTTPA